MASTKETTDKGIHDFHMGISWGAYLERNNTSIEEIEEQIAEFGIDIEDLLDGDFDDVAETIEPKLYVTREYVKSRLDAADYILHWRIMQPLKV